MATATVTNSLPNIDQLVTAVQSATSYGLLWNGDETRDAMFMGQRITFPLRDQISAGKGLLDRPVYDRDGDAIPGSLLIEDIRGEEGTEEESKILFDAKKAVVRWLGLPERYRGQTFKQRATGYLKAGLLLLPKSPSKEDIKSLRIQGETSWESYKDELAKIEVAAWQRHRQLGGDQPFDDKYDAAVRRLKARSENLDTRDKVRLGIEQDELNTGDLEDMIVIKAALMDKLTKMGYKDEKMKVATVTELLEDPKVRMALKKTHRIRKVGNLPEKDEALEAQVQAQIIAEAKQREAEIKEPDPVADVPEDAA